MRINKKKNSSSVVLVEHGQTPEEKKKFMNNESGGPERFQVMKIRELTITYNMLPKNGEGASPKTMLLNVG